MSAACKTILKTLHARGAKPPPWAGEWPPALTRMFYARRNWPTLLRRHPARRETAAQAADLPEAAFQTHGRPRHLPILGPLLGGRQFIALASIAIRPLASGQRRTVTGQLTSNPHPTSRISQVVRAGARHEAVFIANCAARRHFWVCGLANRSKRSTAHTLNGPEGRNAGRAGPRACEECRWRNSMFLE